MCVSERANVVSHMPSNVSGALFIHSIIQFCRHVQVNNECAIEFYQKFGFEIVETKEQYYKRIEPAGAHVLEKNLRKSATVNSQCATETNCATIKAQQNGIDTHNSSCTEKSKKQTA